LHLGLQAQTPDSEERRWEGSTLYVRCPYTAGASYQQKKVWCHVRDDICEPLVETNYPYQKEVTKGRVRIEDNPTHKTVSITMTNLQAEDSGIYSCAYRTHLTRIMEVVLLISPPPSLLVVLPILCHTMEKACAATAQLTPISPCLSGGHAGGCPRGLWSQSSGRALRALLTAETQGRFP
uniref:Immunoglobulin domain-containing protein n=1 Tax=Falco tinnunculus TaxID=100819 RepID=A0A8C4XPL3_FALTI